MRSRSCGAGLSRYERSITVSIPATPAVSSRCVSGSMAMNGTPNSRYAAPCARALAQNSAMHTSGTSRSLPLTVLRTKCTIGTDMVMKA